MAINIVKTDGSKELLDLDKINKVVLGACKGVEGVSASEIIIHAKLQFVDTMASSRIQELLVKSATDLITETTPNYQVAAARLKMYGLRKKVYGQYKPFPFSEVYRKNVELGKYDKEVLTTYTKAEWDYFDSIIQHKRDKDFSLAACGQLLDKYLVQDRITGEYFETPQVMYMGIAITLLSYIKDKGKRLEAIHRFYEGASTFSFSLPTPIMSGVRTPTRQFSSCFPAGQQVWTEFGMRSIEDVVVGDKVLTDKGTLEEIYHTSSKTYKGDAFISMRNSYSIPWDFESTEDHEIVVKKFLSRDRGYESALWTRADEVSVKDAVQIPFDKTVKDLDYFEVPVPEGYKLCEDGFIRKLSKDSRGRSGEFDDKVKPSVSKVAVTEAFMTILGYFLAEGHVNIGSNSFAFTFNKDEQDYHNDVKTFFNSLGHHVAENVTEKNAKSLLIHSLPLKKLLLSLVGTGFDKKFISEEVMKLPSNLQKHLLSGAIRGDGCTYKGGMKLSLVNKNLVKQLGDICLRCGLYPSLNKYDASLVASSYSTSMVYSLHLSKRPVNYQFLVEVVGKSLDKLGEPTRDRVMSFYEDGDFYAKVLDVKSRKNNEDLVFDLSVKNTPSFTVSGVAVHNCVVIKCGDSLPSINATATAITNYVSKKAGIGLDHGAIRGEGAPIRNGEMVHTGLVPFLKYHTAALKSCSQGGIRGGAGTTYYPFWHNEFENLIVLKNNKGVEENRERRLDYGLVMNGFLFELYMLDEDVYLFQPNEVPELYKLFYSSDLEAFKREYIKCTMDAKLGKLSHKVIKATTLLDTVVKEREETGRIYIKFADNVNKQSPFDSEHYPIYQSNLCVEIAIPTKEFQSEFDESGRIALCTLASMNMGKFVNILWDDELRKEFWADCEVLIQALDGLLEYQDYPMIQAKRATEDFRTLGVGVVNVADFHAQLGVKYGEQLALEYMNRWMEFMSYGLTKASAELAKEYGACGKSDYTCYGQGKFPWELRNKNIDKVVTEIPYLSEWEDLRKVISEFGIRNATLTAVAPTESSAQVLNATNGMEMPKAVMTVKASKSGHFKQIVPNPELTYQYLWDQPSPRPYLINAAVMQKWVDQSLSTNTWYNPKHYEDEKVPVETIIANLYTFYKLGGKTLYYSNIEDGSSEEPEQVTDNDCCVV